MPNFFIHLFFPSPIQQLATKKKQEEKIASLPSWLKFQKQKVFEEKRKKTEVKK